MTRSLLKRSSTPASNNLAQVRKGFTLIELLVVIAIIGLLASIILASLSTAQKKGRDARRVSDLKEVQLALELYYDSNSAYPPNLGVLVPTYISVMPSDPSTSVACTTGAQASCYEYMPLEGAAPSSTTCGSYHLGGNLEISNNSALSNDSDATIASDGQVCTASGIVNNTGNGDFAGLDTGPCMVTQTTGPTYCYDVEP